MLIGEVPWLFNNDLCNFSEFHLAFNVDLWFKGGSFLNCITCTTCPNHFCGGAGHAPKGSLSVTVPGHNREFRLQHYHIPTMFLKPALLNGSGKDKCALILVGDCTGQMHPVMKYCRQKEKIQLDRS